MALKGLVEFLYKGLEGFSYKALEGLIRPLMALKDP